MNFIKKLLFFRLIFFCVLKSKIFFKTAISTQNFIHHSKLPEFEVEASTSNYLSNLTANLADLSIKTSSTGIISTNPPISTRERLKTNNLLANYIDPDLQFTLEGFEDVSMTKTKKIVKQPWFVTEKDERETPSPLLSENQRKLSIDSMDDSMKDLKINEQEKDENNGLKKKGKKTRQRVKKLSVNFTIAGGTEHKEIIPLKNGNNNNQWNDDKIITGTSQMIAATVAKDRKEDYWYYDPISDGFYYENNGSRGWKKRNSKIHGPPPPTTNKKCENIEQQKQQQMIKNVPTTTTTTTSSSSVKYYDPASDGYFFEMASVDGWRRRQIQEKKQNNPPPMSNQHFPPLGTSPIILSQTATPTPSPADSYISQSKILSHTQLEDLIVRHPSILTSISKNKCGQICDNEPIPPSNSSTTSSISDEITTPPPMNSSQNSVLMQHFKRSLQLHQSNSSTTLNNGQTKTFSVGSSDEPYEFYWSDTEKPSSISSFDDTEGFGKVVGTRRPETLSFNQMDIKTRKPWWETSVVEQQPRFDVERFIADLPSFDEEKILRNLCVPPTPIDNKRRNTDDSTLFTPTWYNPYLVRTPVKPDQPAPIDVDKIWRTPCA